MLTHGGAGACGGVVVTTGGEGEEGSESERRNNVCNDCCFCKNLVRILNLFCMIFMLQEGNLCGKFSMSDSRLICDGSLNQGDDGPVLPNGAEEDRHDVV